MFRTIFYFILITAIFFITYYVMKNDGTVAINFANYEVTTSSSFAFLITLFAFTATILITIIMIKIINIPNYFRTKGKLKKYKKGIQNLTEAFVAIAAGDAKSAEKYTKSSISYLGNIPITNLLTAESAKSAGNEALAIEKYNEMLENKETQIIAIKGLLIQARKDGDVNKAEILAEKAIKIKKGGDFAYSILFDLYKMKRNWLKAEEYLLISRKKKLISKTLADHNLAIIYLAMANEFESQDNHNEAKNYYKKSYKILPDFAPICNSYAQFLIDNDEKTSALKIIEKAWRSKPHNLLANLYIRMFAASDDKKKIKMAEKLVKLNSTSAESYYILAKTALDCNEPSIAKEAINKAISIAETSKICNLMADIEKYEGAPGETISYWQSRAFSTKRDDLWKCSCCNSITELWNMFCQTCNSFDSLTEQTTQTGLQAI